MAEKLFSDEILNSYDKSFDELQKIQIELENSDISVDTMSRLAQKALPLIQACKAKLNEAQGYVNEVLREAEN
jgi:exodeoxyribonuclease VII small subunit